MAKGRIARPTKHEGLNLPRVGMVKTGYKNAQGQPRSCDYFIPTGKYESLFKNAYGANPNVIQVVFWEDDVTKMCDERFEYRDRQGKLYAKGDGEVFDVWNAKNQKYEPYTIEEYPDIMDKVDIKVQNGKGWDVILTLRFILPKVKDIVGYWEYSTKGEETSIPAIRDMFDAVMEGRGSVRGVVFDLTVVFAKSQKPNVTSRYPVVNLIPNQSEANLQAVKGSFLLGDNVKKLN